MQADSLATARAALSDSDMRRLHSEKRLQLTLVDHNAMTVRAAMLAATQQPSLLQPQPSAPRVLVRSSAQCAVAYAYLLLLLATAEAEIA